MGFIRFAGSVTLSGGGLGIKVSTGNPASARLFLTLMKEYFGAKSALSVSDMPVNPSGRLYELTITPEMNAEAILREVGVLSIREGNNYFTDSLDQNIIKKRCCRKAALRGIFLACGTVSDPVRNYHLEMSCESEELAADVRRLVASFGLKPRVTERRSRFVVYLKDDEQIGDLLGTIGLSGQLFRFQDVRIHKELSNNTNRVMNCDTANLDKTVNAAQKQIEAIRLIERAGRLESLPDKLFEAAKLRLENPELSLAELGERAKPPIGKSGLNHRFEKIFAIADKLADAEGL